MLVGAGTDQILQATKEADYHLCRILYWIYKKKKNLLFEEKKNADYHNRKKKLQQCNFRMRASVTKTQGERERVTEKRARDGLVVGVIITFTLLCLRLSVALERRCLLGLENLRQARIEEGTKLPKAETKSN